MIGSRRFFPLLAFSVLLSISYSNLLISRDFIYATARVITQEGVSIPVEVSDTPAKRALGLGSRDSLRKGWGMLFIFENLFPHRFWMKKMRFPIDIIWLNNNRIVEIARRVPSPEGGLVPLKLHPDNPSNFVLEIEAGRAEELGLTEGQSLRYKF